MKKTTTLKALVLSMIMVFGLVMPLTAQTDGFFKNNNEDIYGDRDGGTSVTGSGITNQQFGQTVPVGSGLLIMVAAGAGYAVVRRKRTRKGMTLLLAAAMLLGMTQCRKNVETIVPTPSHQGKTFVTLTVENDSKHIIGFSGDDLGKVTFENGDFLWVLNNNQVSGKLTYNGSVFSGYIDDDPTNVWSNFGGITLDDNDYLYFCYTSNQNPEMYDYEGMPDKLPYFLWDMSDQKDKLFMVSYAKTTKTLGELKADGDLNSLSCMLYNKCALVKFQLSQSTAEDVTLTDVLSVCRLDIDTQNDNVGATTFDTKSTITLYNPAGSNASDVRWGILMAGDSYTTNVTVGGQMCANAVTIPALANNQLYQSVAIKNTYVFTVDAEGTTVHFSPGNLQYNSSVNTWRFADNQYDVCQSSDGTYGTWNTSGWVDLFGWGTWSGTSSEWNPMKVSDDGSEYIWNGDEYFHGTLINNDETGWFTLSDEQWQYILGHSTYGMTTITVNNQDVHGIIILPDNSSLTINTDHSAWSNNTYTAEVWAADMESQGAVFLPAAGQRNGSVVWLDGVYGLYWSSTPDDEVDAWYLYFNDPEAGMYTNTRNVGQSVRLVRTVQ